MLRSLVAAPASRTLGARLVPALLPRRPRPAFQPLINATTPAASMSSGSTASDFKARLQRRRPARPALPWRAPIVLLWACCRAPVAFMKLAIPHAGISVWSLENRCRRSLRDLTALLCVWCAPSLVARSSLGPGLLALLLYAKHTRLTIKRCSQSCKQVLLLPVAVSL